MVLACQLACSMQSTTGPDSCSALIITHLECKGRRGGLRVLCIVSAVCGAGGAAGSLCWRGGPRHSRLLHVRLHFRNLTCQLCLQTACRQPEGSTLPAGCRASPVWLRAGLPLRGRFAAGCGLWGLLRVWGAAEDTAGAAESAARAPQGAPEAHTSC